jgi:hypothetical protein
MVDLVVTAASVLPGTNASLDTGTAGEAIAAGKAVYKNSTTKKWMLADSNSATVEARTADGIALNAAALNQPVSVQKGGDITVGATLVANTDYWLSDTPGGICPQADVGTGEYGQVIGVAISTSVLRLSLLATGVAN